MSPTPLGDNGMDKEFEDFEEVPSMAYREDSFACGGLSVVAAHLEVAGYERPALVFHFQHANGTAHPALILVLEDEQMQTVGRLVTQAAQRAIAAARRTRRGK